MCYLHGPVIHYLKISFKCQKIQFPVNGSQKSLKRLHGVFTLVSTGVRFAVKFVEMLVIILTAVLAFPSLVSMSTYGCTMWFTLLPRYVNELTSSTVWDITRNFQTCLWFRLHFGHINLFVLMQSLMLYRIPLLVFSWICWWFWMSEQVISRSLSNEFKIHWVPFHILLVACLFIQTIDGGNDKGKSELAPLSYH